MKWGGKKGKGNGWHRKKNLRLFYPKLNFNTWSLRSVAISGPYQLIGINKTSGDLVVIFPLTGPGGSYCSWDLEDLNWYCVLFCGMKDRTSGKHCGVLSLTEWRTESNLQLHRSIPEPNWPFSLAAKIFARKKPSLCNSCCNCKKLHLLSLLSFQKDTDRELLHNGVFSSVQSRH